MKDSRRTLLRDRARQLRRSQTDAEQMLWQRLRARQVAGAKFRRQYPIGPFIVDFCCVEQVVVVELDGGQHAEQVRQDEARTMFLRQQGYRVLRFWNHEVLTETEAVLERIAGVLSAPHPTPLPPSGRG